MGSADRVRVFDVDLDVVIGLVGFVYLPRSGGVVGRAVASAHRSTRRWAGGEHVGGTVIEAPAGPGVDDHGFDFFAAAR